MKEKDALETERDEIGGKLLNLSRRLRKRWKAKNS